jgi:hypothetical protein
MAVRNFTSLKLFALLIFSLELLAPLVLMNPESGAERENTEVHVTTSHNTWGMLISLLCEEAGNEEEREGKEHKIFQVFSEVNFVAVFQCLVRQENLPQPQPYFSKIHSGASLLSFISEYRI